MRVVISNLKVLHFKILNVGNLTLKSEFRKRPWLPLDLLLEAFHVIQVDMGISQGVNKLVWL